MRLAKAWCGCHIKIAGQRRADAKGKNAWRRGPRRQSLGPCQPINSALSPHQNRSLLVALMDRALLELWICFGHLRLPSPCADLASPSSWYCGVTAPRNYIICGIVLVCTNSVCFGCAVGVPGTCPSIARGAELFSHRWPWCTSMSMYIFHMTDIDIDCRSLLWHLHNMHATFQTLQES